MQESQYPLFSNEFPSPGVIRILPIPSPQQITTNWIYRALVEKDRTWDDWLKFIRDMDKPIQLSQNSSEITIFSPLMNEPPYIPNTVPDAWFHRSIAANIFRNILMKTMRFRKYAYKWLDRIKQRKARIHEMRWILRKCIAKMRKRVMEKRVHGLDRDIVTMEEIPEQLRISVYDVKSRSLYYFNAYTMHDLIRKDLSYQSFAIANPLQPKNPFTNIRWSQGQLLTIVHQIQTVFLRRHKFICDWILKFRMAGYCVSRFYTENYRSLQIHAAQSLFEDKTSPEFLSIMEESLNDLFEAMDFQTSSLSYSFLKLRSLPLRYLHEWDGVLCTFWIYENHQIILHPVISSFDELLNYTKTLFKKTEEWIRTTRITRT